MASGPPPALDRQCTTPRRQVIAPRRPVFSVHRASAAGEGPYVFARLLFASDKLRRDVSLDDAELCGVQRPRGGVLSCWVKYQSSVFFFFLQQGPLVGDAFEGNGPQRRPQKRRNTRMQEVATAVTVGCKMPLKLALAVREAPAGA